MSVVLVKDGVPILGTTSIRQVSLVEAPEPLTAVITWMRSSGVGLATP